MARNAVAARKRKQARLKNLDLAPKIASGMTEGTSAEEALNAHPVKGTRSGIVIAQDFSQAEREMEEDPRLKRVHFIAEHNTGVMLTEPNTGRQMIDANVKMPKALRRKIQSGYACINCYEQFEVPWPVTCDVCGYEVAARQTNRAEREFEGETHVGPSKGLRSILMEQDLRVEKRGFIRKVLDGGQGKIPQEWLRDATLMDGLTPDERKALGSQV